MHVELCWTDLVSDCNIQDNDVLLWEKGLPSVEERTKDDDVVEESDRHNNIFSDEDEQSEDDEKSKQEISQLVEEEDWKAYLQQHDVKERSSVDLLLHACLQLTEQATIYHQEIRTIYHAVRNFKKKGTCKVHELLPRLHRLVREDRMPFYLHTGLLTVMSGWVTCKTSSSLEWLTSKILRKYNKFWAVLWEGTLGLFTDSENSRKYLLALSRERRGAWSSIGRRMMKEYAPVLQFPIIGWSATQDASEYGKTSLALFNFKDELQQVLEFETSAKASEWSLSIAQESQKEILNIKQAVLTLRNPTDYMKLLRLPMEVPLKWLHFQVDSIDASAKSKRSKCATLSQALKDITRDIIIVNDKTFTGSCVEDILSEIAIEIMKHASNTSTRRHASDVGVPLYFREMDALHFARKTLIHSARTQGGGDVLDAVHFLINHPRLCICPEATSDPVQITIVQRDGIPVARIEMKMCFKMVEIDTMGGLTNTVWGRVIGTSYQEIECNIHKVPEVRGRVELNPWEGN